MPGVVHDLFMQCYGSLTQQSCKVGIIVSIQQKTKYSQIEYGACQRSHDLKITELGFEISSDSHVQIISSIPHTNQVLEKCLWTAGAALIVMWAAVKSLCSMFSNILCEALDTPCIGEWDREA